MMSPKRYSKVTKAERAILQKIGRSGQKAMIAKHKAKLSFWGKMGGRPRKDGKPPQTRQQPPQTKQQ